MDDPPPINLDELPDDLRGRLRSAIMNKCQHKKQGPQTSG